MNPYEDCTPPELWRHFAALNRIPRRSGNEAEARDYVRTVAEAAGAEFLTDAFGNAVVRVAATPGREAAPVTAIQAHLDMVCEKRPEVEHDFDRDPILPRREGDRVYATGTTLGADNGIGAASALAVLTTPKLEHGPLELIFTTEEEVGLRGATALDPALLSAAYLINLDTEEPDEVIIGCAGGARTVLRLARDLEPVHPGAETVRITVAGLQGGHSGLEIHQPRANAIKLLARILTHLREAGLELQLSDLQGGNAPNAIPRDASVLVSVTPEALPELREAFKAAAGELKSEWTEKEPDLQLSLKAAATPINALSGADTAVQLLQALPHGVVRLSEAFPGKVETSSNLAQVETAGGFVEISTTSRSFVEAGLDGVLEEISRAAEAAGAAVKTGSRYAAWEPQLDSHLQRVTLEVFSQAAGLTPRVEVIHAGLECGVIVAKVPGMEAVSFGPRIRGAHTPEEYVEASTVPATWNTLTTLLAALAANGEGTDGRE